MSFFSKLWDDIKSLWSKVDHEAKVIADVANHFTNEIKNLAASPGGKIALSAVETVIESVIPQSTGLINAVKLWFPKWAAIVANVDEEVNKTEAEQVQDFLNYLNGLKTKDPNSYAGALANLNAAIQKFIADNQGVLLPISTAIAASQVVHEMNKAVPTCPTGQKWDSVLGKCVLDGGSNVN